VLFRISSEPLETERLKAALRADRAGACICFEGWVRDHNEGEAVTALEYEAHEPVAVKEADKILAEARDRFGVLDIECVHRVGSLKIGDCAVWIGVSAEHRGAAFDACRFVIDSIKQRVPIWKKEHYRDGESGWVNCATGRPATER